MHVLLENVSRFFKTLTRLQGWLLYAAVLGFRRCGVRPGLNYSAIGAASTCCSIPCWRCFCSGWCSATFSGLSFHFIGMTAVTLLLDWPLAVLGGFAAQLGLLALGRLDLFALGVNGMLLVVVPVAITEFCALQVERRQPRSLFVYIFCCGFFPAALAALACLLGGLVLLWHDGLYAMPRGWTTSRPGAFQVA